MRACLVILLSLLPGMALAQSVGASLQMEGGMSVFRAVQYLLQEQSPDGLWRQDAALTSLAGCALISSATAPQADPRPQTAIALAVAAVKRQPPPADSWRNVLDARILLRSSHITPADRQLAVKKIQGLGNFQDIPLNALPWVCDILSLSGKTFQKLPGISSLPAASRLAIMLSTQVSPDKTTLESLRSEVRRLNWKDLEIEQIYWAARSLFAWDHAFTPQKDNWQHDILSAMLVRQKGDGAWHGDSEDLNQSIRDTALAIEIVVLCLQ